MSRVKRVQKKTRAYSGVPMGAGNVARHGFPLQRKALAAKLKATRKANKGYA